MNLLFFQICFYFFRQFWPKCKLTVGYPLAQAVHESADFKSDLYQRANNLFGMKYPAKRSTTATGKTGALAYAVYRTPVDSIRDFFRWADYWNLHTDEDLRRFLAHTYAEDPNYLRLIERLRAQQAPNLLNEHVAVAASAGLTLATVYTAYRGADALVRNA